MFERENPRDFLFAWCLNLETPFFRGALELEAQFLLEKISSSHYIVRWRTERKS